MSAIAVKTAMEHRCYVAPLLRLPQTEDDYNALVEALDTVLDAGGADETHPLTALADRMGELVAQYEDAHLASPFKCLLGNIQYTEINRLAFKVLPFSNA